MHQYSNPDSLNNYLLSTGQNSAMSTGATTMSEKSAITPEETGFIFKR